MKKSSAETEPAWSGAGSKVGIQIWRIVKFKVSIASDGSTARSYLPAVAAMRLEEGRELDF